MSIYGAYRSSFGRKRRCDVGSTKVSIKDSVAKFKRFKDKEVRAEVRQALVTHKDVQKLGEATTWSSDKVAKEADFQMKKFRDKLLDEAVKPKPLLTDAEMNIVGSASIQEHVEKVQAKDSQYWKDHARKTRRLNPCLRSLRGLTAVMASEIQGDFAEHNAKTWQLKWVDDPHTASVFIVNDVSTAGSALITRLSLIGGVLMNMTAYETVGKSGVILKHEAFLRTKKT